jgi:rhomboid protease GluP
MDWKRFFDALGMNGTRWQWRILRWQRNWQGWGATLGQHKSHVTYRHKFCSGCGALLDRDEKVCPHCGAKASSWRSQAVQRAFGLVLPGWCPVFSLLLGANLLIAAVGLLPQVDAALKAAGALVPPYVHAGQFWRVLTYGYLHHGLLHIAFNMIALSQLGPMVEDEIGSARFFCVYTLALLGGGLADVLLKARQVILVAGASGALFGLIGFGLSYAHFTGGYRGSALRRFFLQWALYGFLFGILVPGIDNTAHAGGFLAGAVLGFVVERERLGRDRFTPLWGKAAYLLLAATLGAFLWMVVAVR